MQLELVFRTNKRCHRHWKPVVILADDAGLWEDFGTTALELACTAASFVERVTPEAKHTCLIRSTMHALIWCSDRIRKQCIPWWTWQADIHTCTAHPGRPADPLARCTVGILGNRLLDFMCHHTRSIISARVR